MILTEKIKQGNRMDSDLSDGGHAVVVESGQENSLRAIEAKCTWGMCIPARGGQRVQRYKREVCLASLKNDKKVSKTKLEQMTKLWSW